MPVALESDPNYHYLALCVLQLEETESLVPLYSIYALYSVHYNLTVVLKNPGTLNKKEQALHVLHLSSNLFEKIFASSTYLEHLFESF